MELTAKIAITASLAIAAGWFIGDYSTSLTSRRIAAVFFYGGLSMLLAVTFVAVWA